MLPSTRITLRFVSLLLLTACATTSPESPYTIVAGEISSPLAANTPDAERGRKILIGRDSNCILCHAAPETGERFFGNLAPPLSGIGKRLTAAQMRARIVDPLFFNKESIMPAYYRLKDEGLNRVAETYRGKPVLNAEQIEDVIAYLLTLK
jgi:L-cysteine S-thiosulfotransferase